MTDIEWPRAILHLDMDAFFVNVHLLEHPEDAGFPIAVGGRPNSRGVVASASYEARRFGVHSAMPAAQALRLCPEIKFVRHNWPLIKRCSHQVMSLLADYGPVEKMSVDEAYVDLTDRPVPEILADAVRTLIKRETGLPASVGLATSKLVAKVASDHEKPEGCTIVWPGSESAFLAPLPARAIWGVGPRTGERLARIGIETCEQLAAAELTALYREFGRQAESLQRRARGEDNRPVITDRGPAKSVSQERTFSNDVDDPAYLGERLVQMAQGVAEAIQQRGLVAKTVVVKFRWADFTTFTRQRSLDIGIDQPEDIARVAQAIWRDHWPPGQKMRLLGVGVTNLVEPQARQLDLGL